jgi:hypothetical protein
LLLGATSADARPAHKQALAQYFGPLLPKKLNDCRTCHMPDDGAKQPEDDRPHNPFGARLKAVKGELRKAGKNTDLDARLDAILQEDSDGDGVSNLLEILTGHFPGDRGDRPTADDLRDAQSLVAAWRKYRQAYAWRPFETVKRPVVPKVKDGAWPRNPIDYFIAAEHEARALKPRPEAPKPVLLRRLYLDLIGLPPTPEELHTFLNDASPDAYEKTADRLLANPHYGERWGRHWMDVWRYSDWAGYGPQVRDSQPHIWRWRDWIIESLNQDKGYDRMILEMLAGDELAPEDPKALAATGYLVRNFKLLSREKWLQDTVEHTAQAFLGVTLGCARCHDHMFDPILQKEYYQVRAIFEPHHVRTDRLPGQPDTKKDGLVRVYDKDVAVPTYLFVRGDDRAPDKSKSLLPGVPEVLRGELAIKPLKLPLSAVNPDRRPFVLQEAITLAKAKLASCDREMAAARWAAGVNVVAPFGGVWPVVGPLGLHSAHLQRARMARESEAELVRKYRLLAEVEQLEDTGKGGSREWDRLARDLTACERRYAYLQARSDLFALEQGLAAKDPKDKMSPLQRLAAARKALAKAEADLKLPPSNQYAKRQAPSYPATSTGRRLAFARWLANRDNPLTARVAVNHIWLRHFGQALVPSVFDFSRNGRPPSHPALLDWLAAEFMDSGWSMKALHRLIVTSNTYRMSSTPDAANLALDRDNTYLWRMPSRRVEAEVVRDCIFYVAGTLDLAMGGPDIDHKLGLTVPRRTLYFQHASEKQMEFVKIFDGPSVTECYERKQSIVPQQALALANSELSITHGRILARALDRMAKDAAAFTVAAFEKILSRSPTTDELTECSAFLEHQTEHHRSRTARAASGDLQGMSPSSDPKLRARESLVHVLLNHHEFVTIR